MQKVQQQADQEMDLKATRLQNEQFKHQCNLEKKELQRSHQEQLRQKANNIKLLMNKLERETAAKKI